MNIKAKTSERFVKSKLTRPYWISQLCHQEAIGLLDASPSMEGQKAKEASEACSQLVCELAKPVNKEGFSVSIIEFYGKAQIVHDSVPAVDLVKTLEPIVTSNSKESTNITAGLELAKQLCLKEKNDQQSNIRWLRPVVVLFSDGDHNKGPEPGAIASELRKHADIVTVAYGSDANEKLLRELATSPQHFYRCNDGADLRQFFASVGQTMSDSLAAGTNSTNALAHIEQKGVRQ